MAKISWTKSYRTSDNKFVFGGANLGAIQDDIVAPINGNLINENISRFAEIQESKVAFNTSTGHRHTGGDSRLTSSNSGIQDKDGREGMLISFTSTSSITVGAGSLIINGTLFTATGTNVVSNSGGPDTASTFLYVYAFDSSGLTFEFSVTAPNLINPDGNTDGDIFRYINDAGTIKRCIGGIFNSSGQDLITGTEVSFDASNVAFGFLVGVAGTADTTSILRTTIWTPKKVFLFGKSPDGSVAAGNLAGMIVSSKGFSDSDGMSESHDFRFKTGDPIVASAAVISSYQSQTSVTRGGFLVDAASTAGDWRWMAITDVIGGNIS